MKTLRHPVVSLVLFVVLVTLCITIYNGIEDKYNTVETGQMQINQTSANVSIVTHLKNIGIIDDIAQFQVAVQRIAAPASALDLLGGLAAAGLGIIKMIWHTFTFPLEIMNVIMTFYHIPNIIQIGLNLIILLYLAFIIISIYVHDKV